MHSGGSFCLLFPAAGKKQEPLRLEESHTPYGEALVDEHATTYENPFKFSGKELDDITCLYDHGARSRDPKITMWYGVDPLFEKYPDISPYAYCMGNPVRFVDPDGRGVYKTTTADGEVVKEIDSEKAYYIDDEGTWEKVDAPTEAKHEKPTEAPKQKISKEEEKRQNAEMLAKYRAMKDRISSDPCNLGGQKEGGSFTKQDVAVATGAVGVLTGGMSIAIEGAVTIPTLLFLLNSADDIFTDRNGESFVQQQVTNEEGKMYMGYAKMGVSVSGGGLSVYSVIEGSVKTPRFIYVMDAINSSINTINSTR